MRWSICLALRAITIITQKCLLRGWVSEVGKQPVRWRRLKTHKRSLASRLHAEISPRPLFRVFLAPPCAWLNIFTPRQSEIRQPLLCQGMKRGCIFTRERDSTASRQNLYYTTLWCFLIGQRAHATVSCFCKFLAFSKRIGFLNRLVAWMSESDLLVNRKWPKSINWNSKHPVWWFFFKKIKKIIIRC